jgi:hypothetical protein
MSETRFAIVIVNMSDVAALAIANGKIIKIAASSITRDLLLATSVYRTDFKQR